MILYVNKYITQNKTIYFLYGSHVFFYRLTLNTTASFPFDIDKKIHSLKHEKSHNFCPSNYIDKYKPIKNRIPFG